VPPEILVWPNRRRRGGLAVLALVIGGFLLYETFSEPRGAVERAYLVALSSLLLVLAVIGWAAALDRRPVLHADEEGLTVTPWLVTHSATWAEVVQIDEPRTDRARFGTRSRPFIEVELVSGTFVRIDEAPPDATLADLRDELLRLHHDAG
jgi:hypothetical protein